MKPLLIFGLRGTLVERLHASRVPPGMPMEEAISVGMSKVWPRPQMHATLLALQQHCNLAIWSSSTKRNSRPLVEALFTPHCLPPTSESAASSTVEATPADLIRFQFLWSREHTASDDFRRLSGSHRDDFHATVKDLSAVFKTFPEIATPKNTILIDDTPSKGKMHADNFIWLNSCEELKVINDVDMPALRAFIEQSVLGVDDVRKVLPRRVSGGKLI